MSQDLKCFADRSNLDEGAKRTKVQNRIYDIHKLVPP